MLIELKTVTSIEDFTTIEHLARKIWTQHFTPIIGASQVGYMLDKFQSVEAISSQIDSGWEYYLAVLADDAVGYAGLVPDLSAKIMMLSKFYVLDSKRGKGVGQSMLDFIQHKCEQKGFNTLWLTVNRFNQKTIAWYEKRGFRTIDKVKKDIGGGFVMDDYIMEKLI